MSTFTLYIVKYVQLLIFSFKRITENDLLEQNMDILYFWAVCNLQQFFDNYRPIT